MKMLLHAPVITRYPLLPILLLGTATLIVAADLKAQVALPTATPVATIVPIPTGARIPVGQNMYDPLYSPTITLTVGTLANGSVATKLANLTALETGGDAPKTPGLIQPQSHNGVFDEVNLGPLDASGKVPAPVNVTLQFDASQAGVTVWVQPLDGGTMLGQDADGKPINSPGGYTVVLDTSGQAVISYQPLAVPGRYQVLIRLNNVSSVLPFIILDANQNN